MHRLVFTIFFVLFAKLSVALAGSAFVKGPRNLAVHVGQQMTMDCHVRNGSNVSKWSITQPSSSAKENIFQERSNYTYVNPKFRHFGRDVDRFGSGYIYLNSTQLTDAGVYFCYAKSEQEEKQFSAHLIAVDEPLCETNSTADGTELPVTPGKYIRLKCVTNFSGLWSPTVQWTQTWVNTDNQDYFQKEITEAATAILSGTNIASTLIVFDDFGKTFLITFKIFFRWGNGTIAVNATNIPDFTYSWNMSFGFKNGRVFVWQKPHSVAITLGMLVVLLLIVIVFLIRHVPGVSRGPKYCITVTPEDAQEEPDIIHRRQSNEIPQGLTARPPQNQSTIPLYGRVQKQLRVLPLADKQRVDESTSEEAEQIPVYGKVQKSRIETPNGTEEHSLPVEGVIFLTEDNRKVINGSQEDLQYMERGAVKGYPLSNLYPVRSLMYSESTYAEIDHTAIK